MTKVQLVITLMSSVGSAVKSDYVGVFAGLDGTDLILLAEQL